MSLLRRTRLLSYVLAALVVVSLTSVLSPPAARAVGFTVTPAVVAPGADVTVQVGSCPPGKSWVGLYNAGADSHNYLGWVWCTGPTWTLSAPRTPGFYDIRGFGSGADGDEYNEQFGAVTFRVTGTLCRYFTSTIRWGSITVNDLVLAGIPIPDAARAFLDRVVITDAVAYAQLKGTWCWENNRVVSQTIRPLESALTGSGPLGIIFSVQSVATGAIIPESYNGGTRYRVSQSTARVTLTTPAKVTLVIPGTQIGIEIPAGTSRPVRDMRMDTLLTGAGNAECAPTVACDVSVTGTFLP